MLSIRKGGKAIQENHGGLKNALVSAYPELTFADSWHRGTKPTCLLPPTSFSFAFVYIGQHPKYYWKDSKNCRTFFEEFAQGMRFDPLDASNWQSLNLRGLLFKQVLDIAIKSGLALTL